MTLPDPGATTAHAAQASVNTMRSQSDAAQTSAQVHVVGLARNDRSKGKKPPPYGSVGERRLTTNGQMETTRSFGHPANRHITSPPAPSHSFQIPTSRLILRFLAIFSAQHLPVYDDLFFVISAVANMCAQSISPLSASHRSPDQDTMRSAMPRTMDFQAQLRGTQQLRRSSTIIPSPSLEYPRKTWWDNLLDSYAPSRAQAYVPPPKSLHETSV